MVRVVDLRLATGCGKLDEGLLHSHEEYPSQQLTARVTRPSTDRIYELQLRKRGLDVARTGAESGIQHARTRPYYGESGRHDQVTRVGPEPSHKSLEIGLARKK